MLGEERRGGFVRGSVLATREVPKAAGLPDRLDACRASGDEAEGRRLVERMATLCQAIFRAGGDHPDMHPANFLDGIRGKATLATPIAGGHVSTMMAHLGNIAWKTGRALTCDPATGRIANDADATAVLGWAGAAAAGTGRQ